MSLHTLAFALPLLVGFAGDPPQLQCEGLPELLVAMEMGHYARTDVAPVAEKRAIEQYIRSFDSSKTVFLKDEVASFERRLPQVFVSMRKGDCSLLDEVAKLSIKRAKADEAHVKTLLGPKFKLDESVQLELDAKKRTHPKTEAERKARLRSMLHFQISNQLIAGTELDKAKKRVIHRYELATRRISERRETRDLPELFAQAFASGLDPHSSYFTAKDLADFRIQMRLSLEGIGAVLRSEEGFTRIQSVVPGGAADKEGSLRPKDKIIAVAQKGGEPVGTIDMDLRDVVQMIRGKKDTVVILTVQREGKDNRTFDIEIVRAKIDVKEQAAKIVYETRKVGKKTYNVGVIDLPSFYGGEGGRSALADVRRLLEEAKAKKVDGIVLDLSENGGGLLNYAVQISGLFMQTGAVVATKSSSGQVEVLADEDDETVYSGPLVVLISPVSASASEILAGAIKDYGRGVIAGGAQTFGKGTVQQLRPLPGGLGALKLTMGMFFRPSGRSTQQDGVRSDVRIPSVMDAYDLGEGDLDHSLPMGMTPPFLSSTANARGAQRWAPVSASTLTKLRAKSEARVKTVKILREVKKDAAQDKKKDEGPVKLADIRKKALDKKKDKKDDGDEDAAKKEYELKQAAFASEGVDIAVDLIRLQQ